MSEKTESRSEKLYAVFDKSLLILLVCISERQAKITSDIDSLAFICNSCLIGWASVEGSDVVES